MQEIDEDIVSQVIGFFYSSDYRYLQKARAEAGDGHLRAEGELFVHRRDFLSSQMANLPFLEGVGAKLCGYQLGFVALGHWVVSGELGVLPKMDLGEFLGYLRGGNVVLYDGSEHFSQPTLVNNPFLAELEVENVVSGERNSRLDLRINLNRGAGELVYSARLKHPR